MKKTVNIALAVLLSLSLAACGRAGGGAEAPQGGTQSSEGTQNGEAVQSGGTQDGGAASDGARDGGAAGSALEGGAAGTETVYAYETQELWAERDGNRIYGVIYIPRDAGEQMPAVIFSHGYGGNYRVGAQYAQALAEKGYVVYCFDFCGGSPGSRSDGSTLEMSVFTEQADLEAVIRMMQGLAFVDSSNLFLMGTSQGGAVSALAGAAHEEEIRGMVLLYPAFVLADEANRLFRSVDEISDTYHFMWMDVGRAYFEPLIGYDIYEDIGNYGRDVLLIHGDADSIVPLSYSERALEVYPSAELKVIDGGGHGFSGADAEEAIDYMLDYLEGARTTASTGSADPAGNTGAASVDAAGSADAITSAEGKQIRMTAGDVEVLITLNDSAAALDLYEKLPLEMELIERNNFAKGMTLPSPLSTNEPTTRNYEIGDFGYWAAGPDLAIFYDDIYDQTIVPVIPMGKAVEGAERMADTSGTVRLEAVEGENEE